MYQTSVTLIITSGIKLERLVAGVNSDRDGSNGGRSFLQSGLITTGAIDESDVTSTLISFFVMAFSLLEIINYISTPLN